MERKELQLQVTVDDEVAQGIYSNMAMVNHTETEFAFDFVYLQPQAPKGKVRARVITSPKHAKRFLAALQENISKYEARFGHVDMTGPGPGPGDILIH